MLKRIEYNIFESTKTSLQLNFHTHQNFQENLTFFNQLSSSNLALFNNPKVPNQGLIMNNKSKRELVVYSSVEPGPPASPPGVPPNSLSWILAIAIAIIVPFVNYKWGPLLKNKIVTALKVTEDVVEAVEKVAVEVEKVAEDIANDLPEGGKLRQAVDLVENLAERAAKDAGAIDDFIDKVKEEEEKAESLVESLRVKEEEAESLVESLRDATKDPPKQSNGNEVGQSSTNVKE